MLVLSRKLGEKITIGEGVTISVVRLNGNRVQLGIQAPAHVRICRDEVQDRLATVGASSCSSNEQWG